MHRVPSPAAGMAVRALFVVLILATLAVASPRADASRAQGVGGALPRHADTQPTPQRGEPCGEGPQLVPPHIISVAILGAEGADAWRTDTIMLALLSTQSGRLGLVSIPRDLWVSIPNRGNERINTADFYGEWKEYPGGGPALLRCVLESNLGLTFDHYVRVRFEGFIRIVDAVGGVDVEVQKPLRDLVSDPSHPDEPILLELEPGPAHLDGALALAYARSRRTTGDLDRIRRQQDIVVALGQRLQSVQILGYLPQLYAAVRQAVATDLTPQAALRLGYAALTLPAEEIETLVIGDGLVDQWTTPAGAWVLLPREDAARAALADFIARLDEPLDDPAQPPSTAPAERTLALPSYTRVAPVPTRRR